MTERDQHISAIDEAIEALEAALNNNDEGGIWQHTRSVLAWLYYFEDWSKNQDVDWDTYYRHRDASPNGQALAGLIWLRGRLQHDAIDIKDLAWFPIVIRQLDSDGKWRALTVRRLDETGNWVKSEVRTAHPVWPERSTLAAPTKKETRGRDALYDQNVAGNPLLKPIRSARDYFVNERS